ncbi:hypothetical protein OC842_005011 [Tilletia horrida]|uniref:Uncharacterized protein n=1 Tax=Tilletia horrida TaxID=155126 RepID=A0AAN6JJH1_9BASI|nr:hypothetical protein OC842_005011 [Tilletia horrida]
MLKYPIIFFDISYLSGPPPVTALDDAAAEAFANMEIQQQQAPAAKKPPANLLEHELRIVTLRDLIRYLDGEPSSWRPWASMNIRGGGGGGSGGWFGKKTTSLPSVVSASDGKEEERRRAEEADPSPKLLHKDSALSIEGLKHSVASLAIPTMNRLRAAAGLDASSDDGYTDEAVPEWLEEYKMDLFWIVPPSFKSDIPAFVGCKVPIQTDMDTMGFVRSHWPQGFATPPEQAPMIYASVWPKKAEDRLLPAAVKRVDNILAKGAPAPAGSSAVVGSNGGGGKAAAATDGAGGAAPAIPPPVPPRQPQQQGETVSASTTSSAVSGTGGGAGGIRRVPYPCCSDIIDDVQTYC